MQNLTSNDMDKITRKLQEFMQYSQKLEKNDTYLIVNRNSPILTQAAVKAAENQELIVTTYNLDSQEPYRHFPEELISLLRKETPKGGMGLFDYSTNPDWNLKEVGARIEFLHKVIEQVPISWAHSPGITVDMALNGPLQCDYSELVRSSEQLLTNLRGIVKFHITAPSGTDLTVEIPEGVTFDTDCTIGLNEKARVTGNMLEDEKIRGTCHLAPGNVRCHVDMLVAKPTIIGYFRDGSVREIMENGVLK